MRRSFEQNDSTTSVASNTKFTKAWFSKCHQTDRKIRPRSTVNDKGSTELSSCIELEIGACTEQVLARAATI